MMIKTLFMTVLILACGAVTTETAQRNFNERDDINRTFQLPPGARVEVSSIRGPVEITNGNSATAEVQIIRTARTRADLDYHKVDVEQNGNSLIVRGIQEPDQRQRQNIQVNHHVLLKLPRDINLSVTSVSGSLRVSDVDGEVHVLSISGSVNIGNVGRKLQVNSVSGDLDVGNAGADARVTSISGTVSLGQVNGSINVESVSGRVIATPISLSPQGIHIRSVSGSIEIRFKSAVDADFSAESISGQVYLDVPNVNRDSEEKSPNVHARIGAGGTPIVISSVTGNVRLTQS